MDTRKTNTYTNTFDPSRSYICTSAAIVGITWSAVEIVRRYDHKQPYKILLPAGMWACGLLAGYLPLSYQSTMRVGNEIAYFIWSPGASITKHIVARVGTHYLN